MITDERCKDVGSLTRMCIIYVSTLQMPKQQCHMGLEQRLEEVNNILDSNPKRFSSKCFRTM